MGMHIMAGQSPIHQGSLRRFRAAAPFDQMSQTAGVGR
jgi:hypothetical protein